MSLYRRRLFTYCFILLLLIVQSLVYKFYFFESDCDNNISTLPPHIINGSKDIIKLNPRILCWIPTTLQRLDRAIVAYQTWAKQCDRSVFIIAGSKPSDPPDPSKYPFSIAYLGDEKLEDRMQLSEKTLLSLLYIYNRYIQQYDWFFKGDDDTFVIMENLRHFLRRQRSDMPTWYGYIAKTSDRFYPSGGAGYVLSQEALLQFGKQILTKSDKRKLCDTDRAEDINLAYCLARINIYFGMSRDDQQLERFHPMTFEQHFMGNFTRWILKNAQFDQKKGEDCCSPLTITFHSLSPDEMRMMYFLLYKIQKATI